MDILIASKNKGKIEEIKRILNIPTLKIISLNEIPESIPDIPETGKNYSENAFIKAKIMASLTGKNTLADDSGIEIDFLNGDPGIRSARFPTPSSTDKKKCEHVLSLLDGLPESKRGARFVCELVLYMHNGETLTSRGECNGIIADKIRGEHGFGYDPIFIPSGYDKTFAELHPSVKNKISHRFHALMGMKKLLLNLIKKL